MEKRLLRAKRLFEVQHQLYRTELQKLQELQQAAARAKKAEDDALSLLGTGSSASIPPQLLSRVSQSAGLKARALQSALEAQTAQTLDQSMKEAAAKARYDSARAESLEREAKRELESAIDAYLRRER